MALLGDAPPVTGACEYFKLMNGLGDAEGKRMVLVDVGGGTGTLRRGDSERASGHPCQQVRGTGFG